MDEAAPAPGAPGSLSTKSSSFRRSLVPSGSPTDAEKDSGEEETGQSRPFKPKSVFANISALTVSAEVVATLDIGSSHQSCIYRLEEHGDHSQQSAEIAADSGAQRKQSSEQSADAEEEGDQHKGKHESSHVKIVAMVPDKVSRHVRRSVKVPMRSGIERERRMYI